MINPCYKCNVAPELRAVGDWKQYFVYICPKCHDTPVRSDEARLTEWGARKIWNKATRRIYGRKGIY